ncbi:MAG: hypothetical protein FJ110_03060 [Deltaproteobacteria bacterium]|nr:hypothetical protein [Deltaproteobacteria bacterium]
MKTDPIVKEVRRIRKQIENEAKRDPELFYQHLKKMQKPFSEQIVCRQPKPLVVFKKKKVA